jgi:hypothetical protein
MVGQSDVLPMIMATGGVVLPGFFVILPLLLEEGDERFISLKVL